MFAFILGVALVCSGFFAGTFTSSVPIKVVSDRTGLVMESGAKVKMRGVEVGRVAGITGGNQLTSLKVDIFPEQVRFIPANVQAEIEATTVFGAKYVNLILPDDPSPKRLTAGAVVRSRNVSTEVNTVFQNLVGLLDQIDVAKLNAVLIALADGVRGQGQRIGEATTDANQVLLAVNPRMDAIGQNWREFKGFSDAYAAAAHDILATLDAASTTSTTVINHAKDLDALLLNIAGFANSGIGLLGPNRDNLVNGINGLEPTTDLLYKYNPVYTCMLVGADHLLQTDGYKTIGGNGRSNIADAAILLGEDPYRYPDNLPIVAAKGGPGGKPGCGSLPDVSKNFPVQYQVTNTGWGTGLDQRPNPGIGFPGWVNFFPVTKGVPEPPKIRYPGGPAPGPVPYPGAPPYGAPLYGPDGAPLYPGVPPAPGPPAPAAPSPPDTPTGPAPPSP
jgi:phospholipid/cholesterol/gamma-HCH transport system substrate-binding protein